MELLLPRLCSCSGLPSRGLGRGFHRAREKAVVTGAGPHPEATHACVPTVCFGVAQVAYLSKRCVVCPWKCRGWGMRHLASLRSAVYVRVYGTHPGGMGEDDDVGWGCTTLDTSRGRRLHMDNNNLRAWPDTSCAGGRCVCACRPVSSSQLPRRRACIADGT